MDGMKILVEGGFNLAAPVAGIAVTASQARQVETFITQATKSQEEQERVAEYYRTSRSACTPNATFFKKEFRLEPIKPNDCIIQDKTMFTVFSSVHMAIIFDDPEIHRILKERMMGDEKFAEEALFTTTQNIEFNINDFEQQALLPEEVYLLTGLHLAVKYNIRMLKTMMEVARRHKLMQKVWEQKDFRDLNILQFATFNRTTECLE